MLINPRVLSLITTHQCTAACEHCCFQCSPKVTKAIGVPVMHRLIDEASEIPSIRVVVFTGGECFLLGKDLDNLVEHATKNSFITRFVSNGYWGTSRSTALKRIGALKKAGLKEANFSTGDNHQKYVNPGNVRYGAMACADHGIYVSIMAEMFSETSFELEDFINADPEFKNYVDDGKIIIKPSFWMSFDKNKKIKYEPDALATFDANRKACDTILNVISVTPNHEIKACCGLPQDYIEDLTLGNIASGSLKEVLARLPDDFIKIWIHVDGPGAIIRYANRLDPNIGSPGEAGHICEVCRWMYDNERLKELICKNPPPDQDRIISAYVGRQLLSAAGKPLPKGEVNPRVWDDNRATMTPGVVMQVWRKSVPRTNQPNQVLMDT